MGYTFHGSEMRSLRKEDLSIYYYLKHKYDDTVVKTSPYSVHSDDCCLDSCYVSHGCCCTLALSEWPPPLSYHGNTQIYYLQQVTSLNLSGQACISSWNIDHNLYSGQLGNLVCTGSMIKRKASSDWFLISIATKSNALPLFTALYTDLLTK